MSLKGTNSFPPVFFLKFNLNWLTFSAIALTYRKYSIAPINPEANEKLHVAAVTTMTTCLESALIGSISELRKFLPVLSKSTALYLDIEGWNLCRHGAISVITILLHPSSQAQLIDVSALGDLAFSTTKRMASLFGLS
jgi:hypothetical protein